MSSNALAPSLPPPPCTAQRTSDPAVIPHGGDGAKALPLSGRDRERLQQLWRWLLWTEMGLSVERMRAAEDELWQQRGTPRPEWLDSAPAQWQDGANAAERPSPHVDNDDRVD